MTIALISDTHANIVALEAVFEAIDRLSVDEVICLGDVATLGPSPSETLALLRSRGCRCIRGNHDESLLHPEKGEELGNAGPLLLSSLEWVIERLSQEDFDLVARFDDQIRVDLGSCSMLCYHATPGSLTKAIFRETPAEKVEARLGGFPDTVFAAGHSHEQMLRPWKKAVIINPGSVGMPFSSEATMSNIILNPWAEFATVESQNGNVTCAFHRVPYSLERLSEILHSVDLPLAPSLITQFGL